MWRTIRIFAYFIGVMLILWGGVEMPGRLPESMPVFGDEEVTSGAKKRWAMLVQFLDLVSANKTVANKTATISDGSEIEFDIPAGNTVARVTGENGISTIEIIGAIPQLKLLAASGSLKTGSVRYTSLGDTLSLWVAGTQLFQVTKTANAVKVLNGADLEINTDDLYVDAATSRVGIGTDTPKAPAHVTAGGTDFAYSAGTTMGIQNTTAAGTAAYLSIISGNTGTAQLNLGDTDGEFRGRMVYWNTSDELSLYRANVESVRLTSTGMGVGTTTPGEKLEVNGKIKLTGGPTFHGNLSSAPGSPGAGDIYFDTTTSKHRGYDGSAWNDFY